MEKGNGFVALVALSLIIGLYFLGMKEYNNDPLSLGYWVKAENAALPVDGVSFKGVVYDKEISFGLPATAPDGGSSTLLMDQATIAKLLRNAKSEGAKTLDTKALGGNIGVIVPPKSAKKEEVNSGDSTPVTTGSVIAKAMKDYVGPAAISKTAWISYKNANSWNIGDFQMVLKKRGVPANVIEKNAENWLAILKNQKTKAGLIATAAAAGVFVANAAYEDAFGVKNSMIKVGVLALLVLVFVYFGIRYLQVRKSLT